LAAGVAVNAQEAMREHATLEIRADLALDEAGCGCAFHSRGGSGTSLEIIDPRSGREAPSPVAPKLPVEPEIPQWERPGLDASLRAHLRGPFAYWMQKGNTQINVRNPAWSPDPASDATRIAGLLADGWSYVKGRGPR
jgi:hypothetical protein